MIRDLGRRRGRERRGLALAEGVRLVEEALAAGHAAAWRRRSHPRWKVLRAGTSLKSDARRRPGAGRGGERRRARGPGRHGASAGRRRGDRAPALAPRGHPGAPGLARSWCWTRCRTRATSAPCSARPSASGARASSRSRGPRSSPIPRWCAGAWGRSSGCPRWPSDPEEFLAWAREHGDRDLGHRRGRRAARAERAARGLALRWRSWLETRAPVSAARYRAPPSRRVAIRLAAGSRVAQRGGRRGHPAS